MAVRLIRHSQAGEMGLLEAYKSPNLAQILNSLETQLKLKATIPPRFISVY